MSEGASDTVDVAFGLDGMTLPADYSFALMCEVVRCLPWLAGEPEAGIHPIRGARTDYGVVLLPRRAKLVLRLPERRVADSLALAGQQLEIAGKMLRVRDGSVRRLRPWGALYAHLVTSEDDGEQRFLEHVASRLVTLETPAQPVCGRRHTLRTDEGEIVCFSLMLHTLAPEHSIRVQCVGIGGSRKLGCGIFVPHRLAAAVGSG
jgi:CRISPR-associated protein Cas6